MQKRKMRNKIMCFTMAAMMAVQGMEPIAVYAAEQMENQIRQVPFDRPEKLSSVEEALEVLDENGENQERSEKSRAQAEKAEEETGAKTETGQEDTNTVHTEPEEGHTGETQQEGELPEALDGELKEGELPEEVNGDPEEGNNPEEQETEPEEPVDMKEPTDYYPLTREEGELVAYDEESRTYRQEDGTYNTVIGGDQGRSEERRVGKEV